MNRESQRYKQLPSTDGETSNPVGGVRYLKPSIYWLIPVFIIFNISMGAVSMPRTNLIISLTCRNMLSGMVKSTPNDFNIENKDSPRHMISEGSGDMSAGGSLNRNTSVTDIIIGEHNDQCSVQEVESATAMLSLWGNLIAGIIGAIMTPVWGRFSDRFGRVKALGSATAIMLVSQTIELLMAVLPDLFTLKWIYASYIFEGVSGTFILIMALGSAYAADCTIDSRKSTNMGLLHGSMYFGMAFGPIFGAVISSGSKSQPLVIFYTALAMNTAGVIYILLLLPESLERSQTRAQAGSHHPISKLRETRAADLLHIIQYINPIHALYGLITPEVQRNSILRRNILTFTVLNTLTFTIVMGGMGVIMMYSEYTFKWNNQASGIFLSSTNLSRTVALTILLPLAIRLFNRYNSSATSLSSIDILLIRVSILADITGYAGYALAPSGALFTISGVIASLDSIALAVSEATLSKLAGKDRTGEVLGSLGFLQAFARILGPTAANIIYSQTVESKPSLIFWVLVSILVAGYVISFAAKVENDTDTLHETTDGEVISLEQI